MAKIVIEVGQQMDGATFRLSPKTKVYLSSRFKDLPPFSSVFVSHEIEPDCSRYYALGEHIAIVLTGLGENELKNLGGFEFVTPADGKVVFESVPTR